MKKKTQCLRGHDTSLPDSRYQSGACVVCRTIDGASPEVRAKQAVYNASTKGKATHTAYIASPEYKARTRRANLKKWGWTPEMFEQTLLEQGYVCAACRKPFTEEDYACADHKHVVPPEPRGILHNSCNAAIGHFKDNPETMRSAVDYVEAWA